jgi:predicted ester cyclase
MPGRGLRGGPTVDPMATFVDDPVRTYARYITACNERRFGDLDEFIATNVEGVRSGVDGYRDGLRDITVAFPDFYWRIEDLIVNGRSMAARLTDTGTHHGEFGGIAPTGLHVQIQELAVYRIDNAGKIVRCWGDLEAALRSELLAGGA